MSDQDDLVKLFGLDHLEETTRALAGEVRPETIELPPVEAGEAVVGTLTDAEAELYARLHLMEEEQAQIVERAHGHTLELLGRAVASRSTDARQVVAYQRHGQLEFASDEDRARFWRLYVASRAAYASFWWQVGARLGRDDEKLGVRKAWRVVSTGARALTAQGVR